MLALRGDEEASVAVAYCTAWTDGLSTQSYSFDSASRVTNHTQDSVSTTYGYDDQGQLTSESRTGYSASYTYDANGNRASKTLGGVTDTYTNDDSDKLTQISQGGTALKTYGYDAAGRTTSVVTSAGTTTLSYDYESRVTGITYPNSSTNSFVYNGLDTRVGKTDSAGTATYKRDGAYVTDPVLTDGSAAFTPSLWERRGSTTTYFHAGLKNHDRQSNTSQTVTGSKQYDAFGLQVSSTGSWNSPFSYGGPFGYQEDGDSGLKLLGHRYYDASTGRFLTRDPAKFGRNWRAYCDGNPISMADSNGLDSLFVALGFDCKFGPGEIGFGSGFELNFDDFWESGFFDYSKAGIGAAFGLSGGVSAWQGDPLPSGGSDGTYTGISAGHASFESYGDGGYGAGLSVGPGKGGIMEGRYKYTKITLRELILEPFVELFASNHGRERLPDSRETWYYVNL